MMNNEDPKFIFGCGLSCVFRFPKIGGMATNQSCECVKYNMTPLEAAELRNKIRDLVNYAAVLRLEHKEHQKMHPPYNHDPFEIVLGC